MWTRCVAVEFIVFRVLSVRQECNANALQWDLQIFPYIKTTAQQGRWMLKRWQNIPQRLKMGRFMIYKGVGSQIYVKSCASNFLPDTLILAILWYPHFLMGSCHCSSTILQNQAHISGIPMINACFWASWSLAINSWPCLFFIEYLRI